MIVAAAVLALGSPRAAGAQAQPDTAGLVRAVGSVLVDSVVPHLGDRNPNYVLTPATAFDSAVAAVLRDAPGMRTGRRPGAAEWVGTRGFSMRGDTAAVMVEVGTSSPGAGPIDTYIEDNRFLFVRGPAGWRFVRREFVRGADYGAVRG
jgi:hypothetical protein